MYHNRAVTGVGGGTVEERVFAPEQVCKLWIEFDFG